MTTAYICDAIRTPFGRYGGALSTVRTDDLAAMPIQELQRRNPTVDWNALDDVIYGCANQSGEDNRNVARMAVLLAGLPVAVGGVTFNRLCASGLAAVNAAARAIKAGEGEVYAAGGVESMTRAPYAVPKTSPEWAFGNVTMWDTTLGWRFPNARLKDKFGNDQMGETAENVYEQTVMEGQPITRQEQDQFALESQRRAAAAMTDGRFAEEIVPVPVPQKKGDPVLVSKDEHPRPDTTLEALAKLRPAFRKDGTVTAGNSSGINDGAAALLLTSDRKAKDLGLKPLARIVTSAAAGVEPRVMGLGPIPATRKALERAHLTLDQIGLVELNEAFAVQSLAVIRQLGLRRDITNVNGGAIALGHPLGCSGARLMTTLLHEMRRRAPNEKRPYYGLATLCVGVGQGETTIVEWRGD